MSPLFSCFVPKSYYFISFYFILFIVTGCGENRNNQSSSLVQLSENEFQQNLNSIAGDWVKVNDHNNADSIIFNYDIRNKHLTLKIENNLQLCGKSYRTISKQYLDLLLISNSYFNNKLDTISIYYTDKVNKNYTYLSSSSMQFEILSNLSAVPNYKELIRYFAFNITCEISQIYDQINFTLKENKKQFEWYNYEKRGSQLIFDYFLRKHLFKNKEMGKEKLLDRELEAFIYGLELSEENLALKHINTMIEIGKIGQKNKEIE